MEAVAIGPAARPLEIIFEPFVQAKQSLARTEGGLGLGLALVKGLVEQHGGSVEARSDGPGRGGTCPGPGRPLRGVQHTQPVAGDPSALFHKGG